MSEDIKKIQIDVIAKTTKATDEIKRLNKQIKELSKQQKKTNRTMESSTKSITRMGASFKTLGQHLTRLLIIYGSFEAISGTVKTIADFEQSIVTLGAISGATGDELQALEDKALELGKSTIFTASQVADGMTEMARAGLSAQEQLAGIASVLDLSINGLVSVAEATRIATATMNSFGLTAKDLPQIADVLTQSINNSAQNITDLGLAISKVGSVAKQQNISLEETVAILGVLADSGRRGAIAGTQLKISLLRLGANPESQQYLEQLNSMFKDLDVSMYNADGTLKSVTERIKVLNKAFSRLSPEQAGQFKTRIFGTEAIVTGNILLNSIDKIILKTKLMQTSFGVADEQAIAMMDTLQGSYKQLLSALENLQINIGKNLNPALRSIIDDATEFIRTISPKDIDTFSASLAKLLGFLEDTANVFITLTKISISAGNSMSGVFDGMSSGFIVLLGLVAKFRVALTTLALTNPILAGILVSLGYIVSKAVDAGIQLSKMKQEMDSFKSVTEDFNASIEGSVKAIKTLNQKNLRKFNSSLLKDVTRMTNLITKYKNRLAELERKKKSGAFGLSGLSGAEEQEVKALTMAISELNRKINYSVDLREKIVKAGQKVVDEANAERNANDQLTYSAKRLTDAELKSLQVKINASKNRVIATENALATMYRKESKYIDDLKKLEASLYKTRQDFANKRANLNANFENDIANIRASSLSTIEQYNDAQQRADVALANSKKALAQGNLAVAKNYLSIYNSLIHQQTENEIKEGKTVIKSKMALNEELIKDKQAGHKIELAILNQEEKKAIATINNKIALKKGEIKLTQLQIDLQIKALEIQNKMVEKLTGAYNKGFDEDLKKAKKSVDSLGKELNKVLDKQRKLQLNVKVDKKEVQKALKFKPTVDTTKMEKQIKDSVEEKGRFTIKSFDIDTHELISSYDSAVDKVKKKPIVTIVMADTKKADNSITKFQKKAEKPTKNLHSVKVNNRAVERAKSLNSKNTSSTHTIYVRTVQTKKTGGFIRREGLLNGYGGGDKVKSLLEQGEFIVRKEAVKSLGLDRLYQINQGMLPKFATGGFVGTNNVSTNTAPSKTVNLNLNIGNKSFNMMSDEDVAIALAEYLEKAEF